MRIVDLRTKQQIIGMALYVTPAEAKRFAQQLRDFYAEATSEPRQVVCIDSGEESDAPNYRSRSLRIMLTEKEGQELTAGWPQAHRDLLDDYEANIKTVDLD